MFSAGNHQIRPGLAELQDLPPELDEELEDNQGELESGRRGYGDDADEPVYAPAAAPTLGPPPAIGSSSSSSGGNLGDKVHVPPQAAARKKTVRIATAESEKAPQRENDGARVRFDVALGDSERGTDTASTPVAPAQTPSSDRVTSLVGTIQERQGANAIAAGLKPSERKGQSRFAALRRLDKDAGFKEPSGSSRSRNLKSGEALGDAPPEDEVWLDEDGHVMSAFRKNRLIKQSLRPPSVRKTASGTSSLSSRHTTTGTEYASITHPSAPTEQSSRKASSLIQSISADNDAKIARMTAEEIENDLQDAREALGDNFMALLKSRRELRSAPTNDTHSKSTLDTTTSVPLGSSVPETLAQGGTPQAIRQQYFKNEPEKLPSSLEWMTEEPHSSRGQSQDPRFDFEGNVFGCLIDDDTQTRLSGLHHHGKDQNMPGYSAEELLHLARSTMPSQRVLALQTLARIMTQHPSHLVFNHGKAAEDTSSINAHLEHTNVRSKACVIASWYLEERQINVRLAALQCVRACVLTTDVGPTPCKGVEPLPANRPSVDQEESAAGVLGSSTSKKISVATDTFFQSLLPSFQALIALPDLTRADLECALDIICFFCRRSRKACSLVAEHPQTLTLIVGHGIKRLAWPALTREDAPLLTALELIQLIVASDRKNAQLIRKRGLVASLIRFLAISPTTVIHHLRKLAWKLFSESLSIFASLGAYGIGADDFGRHYTLFSSILERMRLFATQENRDADERVSALGAMSSAFRLFATWTVCAIDTHKTIGVHDITWSQVSELGEVAMDALEAFLSTNLISEPSPSAVESLSEIFRLLDVWLLGAAKNKDARFDEIRRHLRERRGIVESSTLLVAKSLDATLERSDSVFIKANDMSILGAAGLSMASFAEQHGTLCDNISTIRATLCSTAVKMIAFLDSNDLNQDHAIQAGIRGPLRFVTTFIAKALPMSTGPPSEAFLYQTQLLLTLQPGDEALARDIVRERVMPDLGGDSAEEWRILLPFFNESLRDISEIISVPLILTSKSLARTQTLFLSCVKQAAEPNDTRDDDEEDSDPMTGHKLWRSPAAGLPLRHDWSLCALDDLLHSGNCAALNRPDALPKDWDANEAQIVRASLDLTVRFCERLSSAGEDISADFTTARMSAAELHMGIIRVLLLEEEQANNTQSSGLITGRDLFRKPDIASLLETVYEIARKFDEADTAAAQRDTLMSVALRQNGPSQPFSEVYSTLISVYDAVSFGDALFARVLFLPLTMEYPSVYRRILWVDYSHTLSTITTRLRDAPVAFSKLADADSNAHVFAFADCDRESSTAEDDEGVIGAYVTALMRGSVRKERNELLFAIAIAHLKRLLWSDVPRDTAYTSQPHELNALSRRIARFIFGSKTDDSPSPTAEVPPATIRDVQEALLSSEDSAVVSQRRAWLQACGLASMRA